MLTLPQATEQIGRYRILSELGRGSMGQVYLALDPNIDRRVALKLYLPALKVGVEERRELRRRFVLEAKAAGRVEHPGIVTIFDADTDLATDLSYIAMEWVDGRSLQEVLAETGPLSTHRTLDIVEQVAIALDAAHRQGLVHRDVKPGNILCGRDGVIKVTDFGIAKLASMSITHSNWIPGSPFYMSPEQLRNEPVDHRSDIYSLGAVLYECLTGSVPFEAESLPSLTYMILEIDPRPPQTLAPDVDETLAHVAMRALAKSPHERYQSALDLARALRGIEPPATPQPAVEQPETETHPRESSGTVTMAMPAVPPAPPQSSTPAAEPAGESRRGVSPIGWAALLLVVVAGLLGLRYGPWQEPAIAAASSVTGEARRVTRAPDFGAVPVAASLSADLALVVPPEPPVETPETGDLATTTSQPTARRRPPARARVESAEPLRGVAIDVPEAAPVALVSEPLEPLPPPPGQLEIVFRNRLKGGTISVFLDEARIWTGELDGPDNFFKRTIGRDVWTTLEVPAGEHVIDVRVTGAEAKIDLVRRTEVEIESGEIHRMRVVLIPPRSLKLSWKEHDD